MFFKLFSPIAILAAAVIASPASANDGPRVPTPEEAPIAILVDISSGQVLHAREADRRFVPASITKVMTLYHAFELIEEGSLSLTDVMTMSEEVWRVWNGQGSTMWINAGDAVSVADLLTGIANISANDASIMLAEGHSGSVPQWVDGMNGRARTLGLANSRFGTPNGWPDEGQTFTTASDLIVLAEALVGRHPELYARFMGKPSFAYGGIEQSNRDPMIGRVDGADGLKTGYTNEAGFGYLGTAERDGQRLVLVVAGVDQNRIRSRVAREYIEWGFSAFERVQLFDEGDAIGTARVQGGTHRHVDLRADRDVFVNVPAGRAADVVISISYDGPLRAPFEQGDEVATLVIDVPNMEPARIPLRASDSVVEAGFFDRIINGIAGWFS